MKEVREIMLQHGLLPLSRLMFSRPCFLFHCNSNWCYKLLDLKLKLLLPQKLLSWLCKEISAILVSHVVGLRFLLTRRWSCCWFVSFNLRIIIFGGSCSIVLCRSGFRFIPVFFFSFTVRWVGLSPPAEGCSQL